MKIRIVMMFAALAMLGLLTFDVRSAAQGPPTVQAARRAVPGHWFFAGATSITVSWPTPVADDQYTVTCTVQDTADARSAYIDHVSAQAAEGVVVVIGESVETGWGIILIDATIHCLGLHD